MFYNNCVQNNVQLFVFFMFVFIMEYLITKWQNNAKTSIFTMKTIIFLPRKFQENFDFWNFLGIFLAMCWNFLGIFLARKFSFSL